MLKPEEVILTRMDPGHLYLNFFFGHWVETSGQTQNLLEGLYLLSGVRCGCSSPGPAASEVQRWMEDGLMVRSALLLKLNPSVEKLKHFQNPSA